jgi:hypothetical protein
MLEPMIGAFTAFKSGESVAEVVPTASGGALEDATAFAVCHLTGLAAFFHTAELKAERGIT